MINISDLNPSPDGEITLSLYKNNIFKTPYSYLKTLMSSILVRNISKVYSGDMLTKIIGIGTALFLIRGLSINDYAAYTAFFVILTLIPGFINNGINPALVRFSAEHISSTGKRPYELYFISLIFQIILYSSFCILLIIIADRVALLLFGQKGFGPSLRYGLIAGLGLLVTQACRGIYQAEERFGHYIKTLWLRQILSFVIIFLLFLLKQMNFRSVAKSIIVVELSVGAIISFFIFKDFNLKQFGVIFGKQLNFIKDFIYSTGWLMAYFLTVTIFQRLAIFMLSHLSTETELANYGVASKYYSSISLLLASINAVLLPRLSKVDMQEPTRQRQFVFKWLKTMGWLIIPIAVSDIFGKSLFIWINGIQYERAFYIFVIFSIGIWLNLLFSPPVIILMARKEFKFLLMLALGALTLNFIGNYLLIPHWAGLAAAMMLIISNSLINIIAVIKILFPKEQNLDILQSRKY